MFGPGFSQDAFAVALGAAGYIGPVSASLEVARGVVADYQGGGLVVGSRKLIGPAGKVFSFRNAEAAAYWVSVNVGARLREASYLQTLPEAQRAAWVEAKRAKLAVIAGRVLDAAARCDSDDIRAALVAESWVLLGRFGDGN